MASITIGATRELTVTTADIGRTLALLQSIDAGVQAQPDGGLLRVTFSAPVSCDQLRNAGFAFTADDLGERPTGLPTPTPARPGA